MTLGKTALIVRLLCSLALIVAAMPLKASDAPRVMPSRSLVSAPAVDCGMPCCEKRAAKTLACCEAKTTLRALGHVRHELAKAPDPCKCEIKALPSAPVAKVKAVVPGFDVDSLAATPPAALPGLSSPLRVAEPGIVGADSGPPTTATHLSDFGRAPPVARA